MLEGDFTTSGQTNASQILQLNNTHRHFISKYPIALSILVKHNWTPDFVIFHS